MSTCCPCPYDLFQVLHTFCQPVYNKYSNRKPRPETIRAIDYRGEPTLPRALILASRVSTSTETPTTTVGYVDLLPMLRAPPVNTTYSSVYLLD